MTVHQTTLLIESNQETKTDIADPGSTLLDNDRLNVRKWVQMVTSRSSISLHRAVLGFLVAHILTWIPAVVDLLHFPFLAMNVVVCSVIFSGAKPIGKFIDDSALLMISLLIASIGSVFIIYVSPFGPFAIGFIGACFHFFFAFMRGLNSMRYLSFTIIGCLTIISIMVSSLEPNKPGLSIALLLYTLLSYMIGMLISIVINLFVFPLSSHGLMVDSLNEWVASLSTISSHHIQAYFYEDENSLAECKNGIHRIKQIMSNIDALYNNVLSEPYVGKLTPKVLLRTIEILKHLTNHLFFLQTSIKSYQSWGVNERVSSTPEFQEIGRQLISLINLCCDDISASFSGKRSMPLDNESLKSLICSFQNQLAISLKNFEKTKSPGERLDWGESVISVYHFSLSLEGFCRKLIELSDNLSHAHQRQMQVHIPFLKWLPTQMISKFVSFTRSTFTGSPTEIIYNLSISIKRNRWALKTTFVIVLYTILFLEDSTRWIWTTYNLTGGVIVLLIVLSPNMGSSYSSAMLEFGGILCGLTLCLASYQLMGPNPYLLGISVVLAGYIGFFVIIMKPSSITSGIFFLLSYSGFALDCWSQQFSTSPDTYWRLYLKTLIVNCAQIVVGLVFNLIILPVFARTELDHENIKTLQAIEDILDDILIKPIVVTMALFDSNYNDENIDKLVNETQRELRDLLFHTIELESELFTRRSMVLQAITEPNIGVKFSAESHLQMLEKFEDILECIRGALNTFCIPWYTSRELAVLWNESMEQRKQLQSTLKMLIQLYQAAILTKRPLPSNIPKSAIARESLSFAVLPHYMESKSSNVVMDELDVQWFNMKLRCTIAPVNDVMFYAYVNWMRSLVKNCLNVVIDLSRSILSVNDWAKVSGIKYLNRLSIQKFQNLLMGKYLPKIHCNIVNLSEVDGKFILIGQNQKNMTNITYSLGRVQAGVNEYSKVLKQLEINLKRSKDLENRLVTLEDIVNHIYNHSDNFEFQQEDWECLLKYCESLYELTMNSNQNDHQRLSVLALTCWLNADRNLFELINESSYNYNVPIEYAQSFVDLTNAINDEESIVQSYMELGLSYLRRSDSNHQRMMDVESSLNAFESGFQKVMKSTVFTVEQKAHLKSQFLLNIGISLRYLCDESSAYKSFDLALQIALQHNDLDAQATIYENLSLLYDEKFDSKNALKKTADFMVVVEKLLLETLELEEEVHDFGLQENTVERLLKLYRYFDLPNRIKEETARLTRIRKDSEKDYSLFDSNEADFNDAIEVVRPLKKQKEAHKVTLKSRLIQKLRWQKKLAVVSHPPTLTARLLATSPVGEGYADFIKIEYGEDKKKLELVDYSDSDTFQHLMNKFIDIYKIKHGETIEKLRLFDEDEEMLSPMYRINDILDALVDGYYLLGIAYLKRRFWDSKTKISELQPTDVQTAERVFAIAMKHLSHLNNPRSKTSKGVHLMIEKSHNQIELIYKRIEVNLGGIRNDIPLLLSLFKDFTTKFECFTTQESIAAHLSRSFFKLKQYEDSLKWCLLEKQYKVNRRDLRGEATCLQRLLNLMEKLQQFSKMRDVTCRLKQISSSLKDKNAFEKKIDSYFENKTLLDKLETQILWQEKHNKRQDEFHTRQQRGKLLLYFQVINKIGSIATVYFTLEKYEEASRMSMDLLPRFEGPSLTRISLLRYWIHSVECLNYIYKSEKLYPGKLETIINELISLTKIDYPNEHEQALQQLIAVYRHYDKPQRLADTLNRLEEFRLQFVKKNIIQPSPNKQSNQVLQESKNLDLNPTISPNEVLSLTPSQYVKKSKFVWDNFADLDDEQVDSNIKEKENIIIDLISSQESFLDDYPTKQRKQKRSNIIESSSPCSSPQFAPKSKNIKRAMVLMSSPSTPKESLNKSLIDSMNSMVDFDDPNPLFGQENPMHDVNSIRNFASIPEESVFQPGLEFDSLKAPLDFCYDTIPATPEDIESSFSTPKLQKRNVFCQIDEIQPEPSFPFSPSTEQIHHFVDMDDFEVTANLTDISQDQRDVKSSTIPGASSLSSLPHTPTINRVKTHPSGTYPSSKKISEAMHLSISPCRNVTRSVRHYNYTNLQKPNLIMIHYKSPNQSMKKFKIPAGSTNGGTPKTVRWLHHEFKRRHLERYEISPVKRVKLFIDDTELLPQLPLANIPTGELITAKIE
ncbi:hypothetical protein HDV02_003024 [Globomyces sp. JEL0801]|nr:hypothetical protein HDV02_003024 [Globomyces sp. JEL0801]